MIQLGRELFGYQENAIQQMISIESGDNAYSSQAGNAHVTLSASCGILADPTGSGKTTTMLGFIAHRYKAAMRHVDSVCVTRQYGAFVREVVTLTEPKMAILVDTTVVIVSPNLTCQWAKETASVLGFTPKTLNTTLHVRSFMLLARPLLETLAHELGAQ